MFRILFTGALAFFSNAEAQVSYYTDGPVVEMVKVDSLQRPIETFKHGVFKVGERMILKMTNTTKQKLYTAVIDIQPDNVINPIIPFPKFGLYTEDCALAAGDTRLFNSLQITVYPPYGVDKMVSVFSPDPAIIEWIVNSLNPQPSLIRGTAISRQPFLQELKWILDGQPSQVFKDCFFSISNMVIIPKKNNETGHSQNNMQYFNAAFVYPQSTASDDCESVKDVENLYRTYPILSFSQPIQAGSTRGAIAEHEVDSKNFVLKGSSIALKGVIQVTVNGENAYVRKLNDLESHWEKEVPLKNGKNEFTVIAVTSEGKKNCEKIILTYDESKNEVKQTGKNYLLVIGINDYQGWSKLKAAATDARQVEQLLVSKFQFNKEETSHLFNEKATKENIDSAFRDLITKLSPVDNLVVYYAGHGIKDKQVNEGYWIPVEARAPKLKKYIDYISNSEIKKYLEALKAKHVLIIADA
jgi:hypothetical protein